MEANRKGLKWALGAAALGVAVAAQAQIPLAPGQKMPPLSQRTLNAIKMDEEEVSASANGPALSQDEINEQTEADRVSALATSMFSMRGKFNALDANHDGVLTAQEFLTKQTAQWARYATGSVMTVAACTQAYAEEFPDYVDRTMVDGKKFVQTVETICKSMDKRSDGNLTWEEFAGPAWRSFKLRDDQNKGYIDFNQFSSMGTRALARIPKPAPPSPAVVAMINRDLAKSNGLVRQTPTAAQIQAEYAKRVLSGEKPPVAALTPDQAALRARRESGAAAARPPQPAAGAPVISAQPAQGAPGQAAPKAEPESISERVQNWFK